MQYALLIYETSADFARREQVSNDATYFGAWRAYYKAVVEAGIYAGVKPLDAPETGTTVRRREGKPLVQDGPYASSKEQLGGFILLELPSLAGALRRRGGSASIVRASRRAPGGANPRPSGCGRCARRRTARGTEHMARYGSAARPPWRP